MTTLYLLLLLLAAISFGAAALNARTRVNLLGAGLFFWVLVPLIQLLDAL